ncbi:ABC transporter permease [Erysipelothrix urinaevulpis]|uniref:ABC transporter permease n=1 Tax=Erysipelothrix urinaevulpis TaxID=2683717 RepID=UPI00135C325C|nr:ABC transporter permease [Erysipelothrix urinaevulpis]
MKKLQNISNKYSALIVGVFLLILWEMVVEAGFIPRFMLPSPQDIMRALIHDFPLIITHAKITLLEAFLGLVMGVIIGYFLAFMMHHIKWVHRIFYPFVVLTQTVPTVAIAPLLVLWLGYGILPKIVLIVLTSFFPITIGVYNALEETDQDQINLLKSMNASELEILRHLKFPQTLGPFFAALKISASYAIVGAVVSEWLGGHYGLGVYMTRVRKAFAFDKMFAVILIISCLSLILMGFVTFLEKKCQPWKEEKK